MNILSLFDGISCARVALERSGVPVEKYYASEVDGDAVKTSLKNYPDIIQLGDVQGITAESLQGDQIDLIIGGSPCQDLSVAKRGRKGLAGSRSGLFYEYLRLVHELKPKYFVLENVATMRDEDRETISQELGVQPILIDAANYSGQDRRRLFWTNIPNMSATIATSKKSDETLRDVVARGGVIDITSRMHAKVEGTLSFKKAWANVRSLDRKSKTLTASGQNISNSGATNIDMGDGTYGMLTPESAEILQGLPMGYTEGVSKTARHKMLGNAFNVDVVCLFIRTMKTFHVHRNS